MDSFDPPDVSSQAERLHKLGESNVARAPVNEGEVKTEGSLMEIVTNGLILSTDANPNGTRYALSPTAVVWENGNQIEIDALTHGDQIEIFTKQAGNRADGYQTLVERINVIRRGMSKGIGTGKSEDYALTVRGGLVQLSEKTVKIRGNVDSDAKESTFPVAPTVEVYRAGAVGGLELLRMDDIVTLKLQSQGNRQDGYLSVATRIEVESKPENDAGRSIQ